MHAPASGNVCFCGAAARQSIGLECRSPGCHPAGGDENSCAICIQATRALHRTEATSDILGAPWENVCVAPALVIPSSDMLTVRTVSIVNTVSFPISRRFFKQTLLSQWGLSRTPFPRELCISRRPMRAHDQTTFSDDRWTADVRAMYRDRDRKTDRQTDRQRQRDREKDRERDRYR